MKRLILPIICALLVGFLYVGPPLMIQRAFEENGERFVLSQFKTYRNSVHHYLPRAREIYDGHFPPSDLSDNQDQPTIVNLVPPVLFAKLISIFKGNIDSAYLAAQFIFSGLIFLAFFYVGWVFTKSRLWSLAIGFIGTLTPIATLLPHYGWHGWSDFVPYFINNFIPLVRTQFDKIYLYLIDNPLLTWPFYLFALGALYQFWKNPKKLTAIAAAVGIGFLFYVYFHFWAFLVVVAGLLLIYRFFLEKNRPEERRYFILFAIALAVIAIPYFLNYFQFSGMPYAEDYTSRLGIAHGRFFGFNSRNFVDLAVYLGLIAIAYRIYWKTDRRKSIFLMALGGSMLIVWNIQLVIGYVPVPHTWYKAISPVLFVLIFVIARDALKNAEQKKWILKIGLAGLLIFLIAASAVKKTVNVVSLSRGPQSWITDFYKFPKEIPESWDWINANLPREPKIISSSAMNSYYLNTHTSARPYLPTAFTSMLPMEEMERRLLISQKLFGVTSDRLQARLDRTIEQNCEEYECPPDSDSNLNDVVWHLYGNYFLSRYGNFLEAMGFAQDSTRTGREARLAKLSENYRELEAGWEDTDADYVYYGPFEQQIHPMNFQRDSNLTLIYQNPKVEIYKIKK